MQQSTGKKIQGLAEILFYIIIILTVILGIIYWVALRYTGGFIVCLIFIAVGIPAAFAYRYLMRGFGEIVDNQAEQTVLLIRMTEYMKANTLMDKSALETARKPIGEALNKQEIIIDDTKTITATFSSRSTIDIVCPNCRKSQQSNRNSCYSCGCKFIYSDEQPS